MDVKDILKKYGAKIEGQIKTSNSSGKYSSSYIQFKEEMAPEFNRYEKWCHSIGSLIKLNISEKDKKNIEKDLNTAHLDVESWQVLTLSVVMFLSVFFIGILTSTAIFLIKGVDSIGNFPILLFFLITLFSLFLFYYFNGYPKRFANKWRLKTSSQMVPAILYIVVYMRHTSNLEKAIEFASQHLDYPLALDFKKIFYNVQIGKYSTIKESLDNYLEGWRDYSREFMESFHLIESSLFEPDNSRRITILEKSLQVVLDGVYDKMLDFTHNVKSPLTNVYMLGVVLPTLGLALLPLASAMLGGYIQWIHVLVLFNLLIPFGVFYLINENVILKRPGGYGETELLEKNPLYFKFKSNKPYLVAFLICLPFFLIGFFPLYYSFLGINDFSFSQIGWSIFGDSMFFGFKNGAGPFGIGALILSLFIPTGVGLFFSLSYKFKTKEIIEYRDNTKQLEKEFTSSLFQLGNRIGNGIPAELVFSKVAESSKGLKTADFFQRVNYNIQRNGMSVEKSIFDSKRGAILYYPSQLIATSMRIFIESSKKGLNIAAISLMSISDYLKNINKINDRLQDILAEVISDIRSNMTFLAPLLSGVVVGLAAMITTILSKIDIEEVGTGSLGNFGSVMQIFEFTKMIPPYYLQIIVGIYLIQIIFILTSTLVVIDSGEDKLQSKNKISKNLIKGIGLYIIVAFVSVFALFLLSSIVLSGI